MFVDWLRRLRPVAFVACAALVVSAGGARADDNDDVSDLKKLLQEQSKQIQELKQRLDSAETFPVAAEGADDKGGEAAVRKIVADYLKEDAGKKKAADAAAKKKEEDEGYKVGSDLKGAQRWGGFGWLTESGHKDFVYHVGARFQEDSVWFHQSTLNRAEFGEFQDGTFFRRIRLNFDGTAWEVCEFNFEFLLDQIRQGIVGLDEMYVGLKGIPFIGTFRVGNFHVPQGLEGDMYSSSKSMTFMERSLMTDAIFEGENLMPGVLVTNSILNDRATWAAWAGRQTTFLHDSTGADFGDGQYAYIARATALPIYADEGRCLLHLGASFKWAKAPKQDPAALNNGGLTPFANPNLPLVRFRARPQLRDAIGDYGRATTTTNATNNFLPGDDAGRLVDTGNLVASSEGIVDFESLAIWGPLSFQAEYSFMTVNGFLGTPNGANNAVVKLNGGARDLHFQGGYAQVAYTLTGEARGYDKRFGKLATNIFNVNTPFWATKRDGGGWNLGRGAWEVAARYDYLDLNDGPVRGGIAQGVTLGLNWYLNNNFKFQFDYVNDFRDDKGGGAGTTTGGAGSLNIPTRIQGFGIRTQIYF